MLTRLLVIAALAVAAPAGAQDPPPPTAEQVAAASAFADGLIAAADASAWFVNSSKDGQIRVTHKSSGMVCQFTGGPRDRISIFPTVSPEIPRGFDVGCVTYDEALDIDMTTYATRYRPMPTEDQDLASTVHSIRTRWPNAPQHPEALPSMETDKQPAPKMAAFDIVHEGKEKVTLALISHRDEWGFKVRATGPRDQATMVALYANILFMGALLERDTAGD